MAGRYMHWQNVVDEFWKMNLKDSQPLSRPFSVLPSGLISKLRPQQPPKTEVHGNSVAASYLEAVEQCEKKVAQIVAECKRNNIKYSDPHFDLDNMGDSIVPLATRTHRPEPVGDQVLPITRIVFPNCTKRVGEIFDDPKFYVGSGPSFSDTRQGLEGDCWFISSLSSLCAGQNDPLLIHKICPVRARNEKVGVYGFVFHRDGEWFSEVIDDKLYMAFPNYDDWGEKDKTMWCTSHSRLDPEERRNEYRKTFLRNSDSLFYGSSANANETWVPLMEKAYAKAHGDYGSIVGGWQGEGVEDLTGGITTEIVTSDILDADELWTKGLMRVNKEFLFGAGTSSNWNPSSHDCQGLKPNHSYCVIKATDYRGERLVQIKDPWGDGGWTGPWSDGSKEWTADALRELKYQFGDDGIWWISYKTFLERFTRLSRTRLFTREWNITQRWTTIQVPWSGEYNDTKFEFTIPQAARTVVVLSKLDDRYFRGLAGPYLFRVTFRLHESGKEEYLIRGYSAHNRSATAEIDLAPGTYEVFLQISGARDNNRPKVDEVVKQNWLNRRKKLLQSGLSFDLAHARCQSELGDSQSQAGTPGGHQHPWFQDVPHPDPGKVFDVTMQVTDRVTSEMENMAGTLHLVPSRIPGPRMRRSPSFDFRPEEGHAAVRSKPRKIIRERIRERSREPPKDDLISIASVKSESDSEDEDDAPWNATCVVGLRVYCHQTAATIKVVTPEPETAEDTIVPPDVDDPEKDAIKQGMQGRRPRLSGWSDTGVLL